MLRSRRIADYITPQKKSRARAIAGGARGGKGGGEGVARRRSVPGGGARCSDLGLARATAKVSVQLTVIIHAPTSLPTHTYYVATLPILTIGKRIPLLNYKIAM